MLQDGHLTSSSFTLQAAARSLAVTEDGQYAASVAAGERHVAVWQATGDPSKKSRSAAGAHLTMGMQKNRAFKVNYRRASASKADTQAHLSFDVVLHQHTRSVSRHAICRHHLNRHTQCLQVCCHWSMRRCQSACGHRTATAAAAASSWQQCQRLGSCMCGAAARQPAATAASAPSCLRASAWVPAGDGGSALRGCPLLCAFCYAPYLDAHVKLVAALCSTRTVYEEQLTRRQPA